MSVLLHLMGAGGSGGGGGAAPLVMPAGASFIFSTMQVSGYTGNCCVVQRASDNATANIGFGADYFIDEAAMIAHAGASTVSFRQPLDQSGNNVDITQATFATQPYYAAIRKRRGLVGITFNGTSQYTIPAGVTHDRQSCTIIMVHAPQHCGSLVASSQLGAGTSTRLSPRPISGGSGGVSGGSVANALTVARFSVFHPSQPCVEIITSSASAQKMRINGRAGSTLAAATSVSMAGGTWGTSATASTDYYGNFYLFAVYPTVLSDSDIASIESQLLSKAQTWTAPVAFINAEGDSIRAGQGGGGTTSTELLENTYLTSQVFIRNTGISGQTLQLMIDNLENNALSAYRPDLPLNIHLLRGGNNDLAGGTVPATLYANLLAFQNRLKQIGYDVTCMSNSQARTGVGSAIGDAAFQIARTDWNTLVNANTAAFDYIIDEASTFFDYTDATLYNADEIHFTPAGYQLHADITWSEAIQDALAETTVPIAALTANPTAVSNLNLYINANNDSLTNMVRDGSNRISTAVDSSSNAYSFTQTTQASRPAYYRKAINNRPAFRFTTGNYLIAPSGMLTIGNTANTIILIYQSENTGDATQYLIGGFTSGGGWRYGITISSTAMTFQNRTSTSSATTYSRAWDTNTHIVVMRRTGTTVELIHDGVQVATAANGENTSIAGGSVNLGAGVGGSGSRFVGFITQPIHYSKYLSNAELNTLCGALATDYGCTWTGL